MKPRATARPPRRRTTQPDHAHVLAWVERIATQLAADGLPPIAGRILGWLMICEPAEQSAEQIAAAIGASRASLTTNLRVLSSLGLVQRQTRPGSRTIVHAVGSDAWEDIVRRQIAALATFDAIVTDGLHLVGHDAARARRIQSAHDVFAWMTRVFEQAPPLPSGRRWSEGRSRA